MENATYAALTRQTGLMSELRLIANNIANANTTGFRAEGLVFSEFVADVGARDESLSMAAARVRHTDQTAFFGFHLQAFGLQLRFFFAQSGARFGFLSEFTAYLLRSEGAGYNG